MRTRTFSCFLPCVILLVLLVPTQGSAQLESGIGPALTGASPAAYYFISKSGEITMPINLWGYVKNPGRYEVPISTDLVQLVSYAGGPLAEANLTDVKITRVMRRDTQMHKVEYSVNLKHLDKIDDMALNLQAGDTVFIDNIAFQWRDFFSIVTTAAIVVTAIANVILVMR
jgi:protein involved in polysaccharide export with SLBB domain